MEVRKWDRTRCPEELAVPVEMPHFFKRSMETFRNLVKVKFGKKVRSDVKSNVCMWSLRYNFITYILLLVKGTCHTNVSHLFFLFFKIPFSTSILLAN